MEEEKSLAEKIKEINNAINKDTLSKATNEELMAYLFLVEKMKKKLEEACNL